MYIPPNKVLIICAGGHAKSVASIFERMPDYNVIGFLDDKLPKGEDVYNYEVLGRIDEVVDFKSDVQLFIAIGDNYVRSKIHTRIMKLRPQTPFATAVAQSATVHGTIGSGTCIMPGAVVGPDSIIGGHCIINTKASIDHDGYMEPFSSLGPGVICGGNVEIYAGSAVCMGAVVREKCKILTNSVVGMGSVVLHDIPQSSLAWGVPAKVQRTRTAGDKYL